MRRFGAAVAVSVLVLGTASATAKRPSLLAMVWKGSVVSLTRVDPMSLRGVGAPSPPIGGGATARPALERMSNGLTNHGCNVSRSVDWAAWASAAARSRHTSTTAKRPGREISLSARYPALPSCFLVSVASWRNSAVVLTVAAGATSK